VPEPVLTSTKPAISSATIASRTTGRLTPSRRAKSRSGGSLAPAANVPPRTSSPICSATRS
jgi:hypothetical protein